MVVAPTGFWLKCPRCRHDVPAQGIIAKSDVLHLRPGVVTCTDCGARFTCGRTGFKVFVIGLGTFALTSASAFLVLQFLGDTYLLAIEFAALISLLIGLFGLQFAGLKLVE